MTKIALRYWVFLSSLLPTLLISVLLGGYFSHVRQLEAEQQLQEQAGNIIIPLAITAGKLLEKGDLAAVRQLFDSSHRLNSPLVTNIALYSNKNQLLLSSNPNKHLAELRLEQPQLLPPFGLTEYSQRSLLRYQPLIPATQPQTDTDVLTSDGYILLQIQKDNMLLNQQVSLLHLLLIIAGCLAVSTIISLFLLQKLSLPIKQLVRQMTSLLDGKPLLPELSTPVTELHNLQQSLQQLSKHLSLNEQDMQQHIAQATSDLQQSMEMLEIQNIQLDLARRKAMEDNRNKSEFLAKMSHELRTPLNGVIGFTRQLMKTRLSPSQHDYLTIIQKSANNLLHLVNDVLDFSRLEEGRMSINPEPFSLRDLLYDATELLAVNAFDKQLELVLLTDSRCPDALVADPKRFTQVLMNIAGNAIKFTEHGSIEIRVSAQIQDDDNIILQCEIEDTGCGISPDQIENVFQGFSHNNHSSNGSGLGLMISQRLIQAMGGDITVKSEVNIGSLFAFTLPCRRNELPVAEPLPLKNLENKTVLYYEPQSHSRTATSRLLRDWGLQVTLCATTAELQQQLLLNRHYDIGLVAHTVAIDQLSQVLQLVEQLAPVCDYTYLLVNTLSPSLREAMLASGANACLSKPAHYRKLANALAQPYLTDNMANQWPLTEQSSTLRALTVDDNEANLKLINSLLAEHIASIDSARNGAEACHKASQYAYDIIFMDINMPVMDGISACQKIRQNSLNEQTALIAVTAHAVEGERYRLMTLGFDEFLSKPLDEKMLLCVLQEFCPGFDMTAEQITADICLPENSLLDWKLALERAGNKKALARDMLKMLIDSLPQMQQSLQQAIAAADHAQLLQHIHKLHGACCYTGVPRLKKLVELLETQLKQGASMTTLEPELFELDDLIDALLQQSKSWEIA